jgi:hypothetical protein
MSKKSEKNVGDDLVFLELLQAAEHAQKHLDTYGTVSGGHEREMESQKKAFDLLNPAIEKARKIFGDD